MELTKNALRGQGSPYLKEHADDLVFWQPWCEEVFDLAKNLDRPIFLSIGYKSCHWCKVLQEESFKDEMISQIINDSFVPILIDREEMPHIDRLYMDFAQLLTQHPAGWPLNLILTPNKAPFYVFTYLPPMSVDGHIGLNDILLELVHLWKSEDKETIFEQTEHLVQIYKEATLDVVCSMPTKEDQLNILKTLFESFDRENGGFKGEVKFPLSFQTSCLIHLSEIFEDQRPQYFAESTLEKQLFSPLYDPILGGFRRYTSDEVRLEPHFEKMLSDNAFLLEAYAHMYYETGKILYRDVANDLNQFFENVLKTDWGYASSLSADHAMEEGGHSLFKYEELQDLFSSEELAFASRYLGVAQEGIFDGDNILYLIEQIPEEKKEIFCSIQKKLVEVIEERDILDIDQKILLGANANLAHARIRAGCYLKDRSMIRSGVSLVKELLNHFFKDHKLQHAIVEDRFVGKALLEDYATLIKALLTAFETGEFPESYPVIHKLIEEVDRIFKCKEGGYFSTALDDTYLVRIKPFLDGIDPSANALMAENFLRLYNMSHKYEYLRQAESILRLGIEKLVHHPASAMVLFLNILYFVSKDKKTIFLKKDLEDNTNYCFCHPFTSVVVCHPLLTKLIPAVEGKSCINNKTTVYVCTPSSCSEPIDDLEKLGVPWNHVL
ncbi:MAG: thioredoxin domain-containing protein [Chlamydiae bacterium]|nr:thioredoxin domain-containing protein [Chlamydiota bacterium]